MDEEINHLLDRYKTALEDEHDFEKLKLKVLVGLIGSIDSLSDSIGTLVINIQNCSTGNNNGC